MDTIIIIAIILVLYQLIVKQIESLIVSKMELINATTLENVLSDDYEKVDYKYISAVVKAQKFILDNISILSVWKILSNSSGITQKDKKHAKDFNIELQENLSENVYNSSNEFNSLMIKYAYANVFYNAIPLLFLFLLLFTFKIANKIIKLPRLLSRNYNFSNLSYPILENELSLLFEPSVSNKLKKQFS